MESALKSRIIGYRILDSSSRVHITIKDFMNSIKHKVIQLLDDQFIIVVKIILYYSHHT